MADLRELLSERSVLVADGAMGTELFGRGLGPGDPPELLNVEHPDRVVDVHRAYLSAGSDIVLTNSFGGTRFRLALHGLHDRVLELNRAAAQVARQAADGFERTVVIAGSMGPSGELLEPMGSMSPDDCRLAFAEQAEGLASGGADLLWIETMSDLAEVEAAIAGARAVTDLPIAATMSFDTAGRTMMGVTGSEAVTRLTAAGANAIGANCGNNLADTEAVLAEMAAAEEDVVLVSKANAGIPQWKGAELHYDGTPEVMAAHADRVRALGVGIIGACCGSSAAHLAHMRQVLDGTRPVPLVDAPVPARAAADRAGTSRRRSSRRRSA